VLEEIGSIFVMYVARGRERLFICEIWLRNERNRICRSKLMNTRAKMMKFLDFLCFDSLQCIATFEICFPLASHQSHADSEKMKRSRVGLGGDIYANATVT
jgi:hypothetical protein